VERLGPLFLFVGSRSLLGSCTARLWWLFNPSRWRRWWNTRFLSVYRQRRQWQYFRVSCKWYFRRFNGGCRIAFCRGRQSNLCSGRPRRQVSLRYEFDLRRCLCYTIGSASGAALTPVAGAPFAADSGPISVTVDPSGKFAYVGNQNSSDVSAFTIGVAGALTTVAGSPFATDTTPRSVVVDRSGKYLYAVTGAGTISGFSINTSSGVLQAVPGSPFAAAVAITSAAANPVADFLYVTNAGGTNTVIGFVINPGTGSLSPMTGSPFPTGSDP